MNPTEIEFAVRDLVAKPYDSASFPFDVIGIYNAPKSTVTKLKNGQTNAASDPGDVLWKKHLFFRSVPVGQDVASTADALAADPLTTKHKPRFIFVTDGQQVHLRDLVLDDTCNVEFENLDQKSDFLLPLAGFERRAIVEEHPADIKAAKRLKKLYDAILVANPTWTSTTHTHELNVFMTRVLFCLYAEDTGIFETPKLFRNAVTQQTLEDGSDVASFLDRIFRIMNVEHSKRPKETPSIELSFPYVNGSLFENTLDVPTFTRTVRRLLLECAELDWTTINPDIFGSMIQTIAEPGARGDLGMHYTSVPNIMKVLQPLFLDDLNESYDKAAESASKLEALLARLSRIRVFDPACGSGNFLIIAYKQLRELEIRILRRLAEIAPNTPLRLSGISLQNFFGIDIVDFACETAKLSLWIAEHQTNTAFKESFGTTRPTLPLGKILTVHNGNALRLDWLTVCPPSRDGETYICGNPPYMGNTYQNAIQQSDLQAASSLIAIDSKELDYIAGWFAKGASYIASSNAKLALVATSSLCQGRQVALLWPSIFSRDLEIHIAYTPFKWANNASHNAGVSCVIIGLRNADKNPKRLYTDGHVRLVANISPYLAASPTVTVTETSVPINDLPEMYSGNEPRDGGHLILNPRERAELLAKYPNAQSFLRHYSGSKEFIYNIDRSCLWITDETLPEALTIPILRDRIEAVRLDRLGRGAQRQQAARHPHRFRYITHQDVPAILVPAVSSEKRQYLPVGLFGKDTVISYSAFAVYDPPMYLIAILSSRLHLIWWHAVAGKLDSRPRYSSTLVYNTFPIPSLSAEQKRILADHSKAILKARGRHPSKTIAWLYDPKTMPPDLKKAHDENDTYLEEYVYGKAFTDDAQRLEHLFVMYARMKDKVAPDSLFAGSSSK